MEDKFWEWLNENATMYRGNNASDCMLAAWKAGVEAASVELELEKKINKLLLDSLSWIAEDANVGEVRDYYAMRREATDVLRDAHLLRRETTKCKT